MDNISAEKRGSPVGDYFGTARYSFVDTPTTKDRGLSRSHFVII